MKSRIATWIAALALLVLSTTLAFAQPVTTRKVVLEKAGNAYQWKLIEAPVEAVGPHQVLVHVRAVALNRGDLEMLDIDPARDSSGLVVASDAAGDVVAVGKSVKGIRPGLRVTSTYFKNWTEGTASAEKLAQAHGATTNGVLGDYIVLEDTAVVPAPKGLSYEEAATLPTAGLTGWMASAGQGKLSPGSIALVQGTGGVSMFALQFAKAAGARVIVTSSSEEKLARAKAAGAQDGINYRSIPAWSARVLDITNQHGADLVIDVGGKSTLEQSMKSLAFGGTVSIVGGLSGYDGTLQASRFIGKTAHLQGVFVGSRADYLRMSAFITAHKLQPIIDKVVPFEQYADALKLMSSGDFVGKIVLRL